MQAISITRFDADVHPLVSIPAHHFFVVLTGDFRPPFAADAAGASLTAPLATFVAAADWTRAGKLPFPVSLPAFACVDWMREAADGVVGVAFGVGVFLLLLAISIANDQRRMFE